MNKKDMALVIPERMERPNVIYTRVVLDDGNDEERQVLRYAAFEQAKNGSQQHHPISIQRWAGLMAHKDIHYAQELALNLTSILKVSNRKVLVIHFVRKILPFGCWECFDGFIY
jgi:hypothetical protein